MGAKLKFEAFYPFSPEDVWVALTDRAALEDWLMPNDFKAIVGHKFTFRTKSAPGFDGIVHCEVCELKRPSRVAYSWTGGGINTMVSFDLAAEGEGTRVIMEQSGFTGIRGAMIKNILAGGWKRMVEERLLAAVGRVRGGAYAGSGVSPSCDH